MTLTFKRSFTADSWYNTALNQRNVPVDPNSAAMLKRQAMFCGPPTIGNPAGGWAMPWSEALVGQTVTITDGLTSIKVDIDIHIGEMAGDDAAIVWRDLRRGLEVATFETVLTRNPDDNTVNTAKPIRCKGYSIYYTTTNGLSRQVGGDRRNTGHRGIVPSSMALHPLEVLKPILSRKKVALGPPGDHPIPNFPMYGGESPRAGGIPEGSVIRRRDPGNNVITQNAHIYGFIIGDTGGPGTSTLKTVQGGDYRTPEEKSKGVLPAKAALLSALDGDTWADWEVMKLGWK